MRLTKKYENGTFGVADVLPCGENSHDFKQLLINNLGWYEERDLARSAPETTESPSETAADKGILTEEELKEMNFGLLIEELRAEGCNFGVGKIEKLIASHRHFFTANAELSFKNMELKKELDEAIKYIVGDGLSHE